MQGFWRNLYGAIRHLHTVRNLLLPLNSDPSILSELRLSSYQKWQDVLEVVWQFIIP